MKDNYYEITRLDSPLVFMDYKAYDYNGDRVECVDLINKVKFVNEPKEKLSPSNILKHAPNSKAASRIRLKQGFGELSDIVNINPLIPSIIFLYYVTLIYLFLSIAIFMNKIIMLIFLVLFVIPLGYLGYTFNLNRYMSDMDMEYSEESEIDEEESADDIEEAKVNLDSKTFKEYKKQIKKLKKDYAYKEEIVKKVIKKRFKPPQLTYDKFMYAVDNCHETFYNEVENAYAIIELDKDTVRVKEALEHKIDSLKLISNQIDNLSDELIITLGSEESDDEVEELLNEMKEIIDSVKDYS